MATPNGKGGRDDGAARDTRTRLCSSQPWCVLEHGHTGKCIEVKREPSERPDWDRRTPDPTGWAEQRKRSQR